MERTYLKQYFTLDLQKVFYIAELVLSERCTIGFCCCQRERRQIVKAFLQGKRSAEGNEVRVGACHRGDREAAQVKMELKDSTELCDILSFSIDYFGA